MKANNYTPCSTKLKGDMLVSPCPSVRLWTESCPLCIFYNTCPIHFIFTHLIKQLQKVCRMWTFFSSKLKNLRFWQILWICNFDFVLFWLGIWYECSMVWAWIQYELFNSMSLGSNMNCSIVWVIMGYQGVSSERRHSSCSSFCCMPNTRFPIKNFCQFCVQRM